MYEKATKKTPEVRDWEEWDGVIRPGFFFAHDLALVRGELCRKGRSPKVSCSSYADSGYSQLAIECIELLDKATGTCVIREIPKDKEKIQAWLDAIYDAKGERIKWQGEGLPNLTLEVFKKLLRAGRVKLTPAQKVAIRGAKPQVRDVRGGRHRRVRPREAVEGDDEGERRNFKGCAGHAMLQ
jgi:hypothetical protein